MDGSRKIQVLKRDGSTESFQVRKLASAMHRGMRDTRGRLCDAIDLSVAVGIYLARSRTRMVATSAIFEMAIKVLRRCRYFHAADSMEAYRAWRARRRDQMRILHEDGTASGWDKAWLTGLACQSWRLSPTTASVLAGQIERELLESDRTELHVEEGLEWLRRLVDACGLGEAVPVDYLFEGQTPQHIPAE